MFLCINMLANEVGLRLVLYELCIIVLDRRQMTAFCGNNDMERIIGEKCSELQNKILLTGKKEKYLARA